MRKDPFNDPFFKDPNYMEKELAKTDRFMKAGFIAYVICMILFCALFVYLMINVSKELERQGGPATAIGKFINDVKKEIK